MILPLPAASPSIFGGIAAERLRHFRRAVGGKHSAVMELYLLDMQLASLFHETFRTVEVLLRETMHRRLVGVFGPQWYFNITLRSALDQRVLVLLDEAIRAARSATPPHSG